MTDHTPSSTRESNEIDLTPVAPPAPHRKRGRNWLIGITIAVVLGAVLFQALTSARVFFYNVDEALDRRDELGTDTFRLQGTVLDQPELDDVGAMLFTVGFNGSEAVIRHVGDEPSDLFDVGIPVVAEGRWDGEVFESRQLLVKHSESYIEDYPDRISDTELEQQ